MHKIKNIKGYAISSLYLMALLSSSTVISFGMEDRKEENPGAAKASKQSLISQFATISEGDLYPYIFSEVLKKKLNETVNKEKYLQCDLTNHYAEYIVKLLNGNASSEEIYGYLGICKTINEPGAAEATIRNNMPQGVNIPYVIIDELFGSVGVKYNHRWDDGEVLLQAHKHGVPLKWDAKTGKYIPLVLSAEDQERYQVHHDFRVAIHGFYKDYTKLLNAQRAERGEHPIDDTADNYSQSYTLEKPLTEEEKQALIRSSKMKLEERDRIIEQGRIAREAEKAAEARRKEEKRKAKEIDKLNIAKESIEAEQRKLYKDEVKLQEKLRILAMQIRQNEEKMLVLAKKLEGYQKEKKKEEESKLREQLLKDEELARNLDKELNGDEDFARLLYQQLNG